MSCHIFFNRKRESAVLWNTIWYFTELIWQRRYWHYLTCNSQICPRWRSLCKFSVTSKTFISISHHATPKFDDISSDAYCNIIFDSLLMMVTIFVNCFTQINGPSIEDFLQSGAPSFSIEGEGQNGIRAQFTFTITKVLIAPSLIINEGAFASYDLPAPGPSSDAFWGPVPVPSLTPTIYDTCCMATHR